MENIFFKALEAILFLNDCDIYPYMTTVKLWFQKTICEMHYWLLAMRLFLC